MARRLILCIDGTWNSRAEETRFFVHPTNVQRISELLVNDGKQQLVFYLRGVGTDSLVDRFVGGVWALEYTAAFATDTASSVRTIERATRSH
ncbi:phospholipase effector Tle1 domain-containing protein [Bradyrhizobium japonicum]